jgi:hypothetical protein
LTVECKNPPNYPDQWSYEIWLQAAVNLQKWRWEKNWPTTVLFANIPSYDLKIYEKRPILHMQLETKEKKTHS